MYQESLVAQSTAEEQSVFFRKVYTHLALAVLAFMITETWLLTVVPQEFIFMMVGQKYSWLLVLGIFWLASFLANKWAMAQSKTTQYFGLGIYVVFQALIFLPLIYMAVATAGGIVIYQAAMLTIAMFAGLSGVAFYSKRDFSFLRSIIVIGGFLAIGLIVAGMIFGFNLGLWFSVGMVFLASASILYETNQLKYNYGNNQYVGASLQLFASVMLLFWYILRILMSRRS